MATTMAELSPIGLYPEILRHPLAARMQKELLWVVGVDTFFVSRREAHRD